MICTVLCNTCGLVLRFSEHGLCHYNNYNRLKKLYFSPQINGFLWKPSNILKTKCSVTFSKVNGSTCQAQGLYRKEKTKVLSFKSQPRFPSNGKMLWFVSFKAYSSILKNRNVYLRANSTSLIYTHKIQINTQFLLSLRTWSLSQHKQLWLWILINILNNCLITVSTSASTNTVNIRKFNNKVSWHKALEQMDLGQKKKIKGDRYTNRAYLVPRARGNHLKVLTSSLPEPRCLY